MDFEEVFSKLLSLFESVTSSELTRHDDQMNSTYNKIKKAKNSERYRNDKDFREKVDAAEKKNIEHAAKIDEAYLAAEKYNESKMRMHRDKEKERAYKKYITKKTKL